jgi:Na+-translocating ferredoxin:NAD+ oxidoreductase RnfC subunit
MNTVDSVRGAGVVGAGGAGFPTYAKLNTRADYVILNAAECEPLLRVDQQLADRYAAEVVDGLSVAMHAVCAQKALIGIKGKHRGAIDALASAIALQGLSQQMEVRIIRDVYPAGDEQLLVYELTGRVVPEMGIPIQVGCVVINPETALNICHAMRNEGVVEKYLTVAGDVPQPTTLKVPVGISIRELLNSVGAGGDAYSVIDGGPMMGALLEDLSGFVSKKSKGYIVLKNEHPLIQKKRIGIAQARRINRAACEQCRMCTDLCPRYLIGHDMQPHKIMRMLAWIPEEPDAYATAALCSQCGLCSLFACPANLHPKSANLYFREMMASCGVKYAPRKKAAAARDFRAYRLVSTKRLTRRLGLGAFDLPAPLRDEALDTDAVSISLCSHVGVPAIPQVSVGDAVAKGQTIGVVPVDALGASIHASISGVVESLDGGHIRIRRKA